MNQLIVISMRYLATKSLFTHPHRFGTRCVMEASILCRDDSRGVVVTVVCVTETSCEACVRAVYLGLTAGNAIISAMASIFWRYFSADSPWIQLIDLVYRKKV